MPKPKFYQHDTLALHAGQHPDPTTGARAVPIFQTTSYITTTLVDPRDPAAFAKAIRPETRLLYGESLGNPGLEVLDIPKIADIAHAAEIPLMIDNTFATPSLLRPIEHGCDIVLHSLTKWMGGHGIAMGGALVDSGRFDWEASGKFPTLSEPYDGYHGIDFAEEFGPQAFLMRARAEGLRDFGACMNPTNAFYLLQGIETLPLRMEKHMSNTARVLDFLADNEAVDWVLHPTLDTHADHELARELLPNGAGSIVSFGLKGGRKAGARFIEACRLASHLANVGDAKTLILHPASTTHQQMSTEQLAAAGVGEDMIRLSVGLEDPTDIINDLGQAIRASQKT